MALGVNNKITKQELFNTCNEFVRDERKKELTDLELSFYTIYAMHLNKGHEAAMDEIIKMRKYFDIDGFDSLNALNAVAIALNEIEMLKNENEILKIAIEDMRS